MVKKFKNLEALQKIVSSGKRHFGDFIIVQGIPYQMVEYSMEGYEGGSRWVSYYNPSTGDQIDIDYQAKTVDISSSVSAWEKDLSLDLSYLKRRFKA